MEYYIVLWTEGGRHPVNRWEKCGSADEVAALLRREGLANDPDVIVLPPEAVDDAVPADQFL